MRDTSDRVVIPSSIGITLPEVFQDVLVGQSVSFGDGKIGGMVSSVDTHRTTVNISHARTQGSRLLGGKGINLPETNLRLAALTGNDKDDFAFVVQHAQLVSYSFVRHPDDVHQLRQQMMAFGADHLGVILKIQTRHAFKALPRLLLASMQGGPFGMMIAWRSGRRVRVRAAGGGAGDPVDLRSCTHAGHLGDTGPRNDGKDGRSVPCRGDRRGNVRARRRRDVE
jgi:pyruvate kinase